MNLSGIAVVTAPHEAEAVAHALAALCGVQVAHVDHPSGRIVLVQEAANVAAEIDGFRAIQRTPGVVTADLVCHYFGDQPVPDVDLGSVLKRLEPANDPSAPLQSHPARNDLTARGIQ